MKAEPDHSPWCVGLTFEKDCTQPPRRFVRCLLPLLVSYESVLVESVPYFDVLDLDIEGVSFTVVVPLPDRVDDIGVFASGSSRRHHLEIGPQSAFDAVVRVLRCLSGVPVDEERMERLDLVTTCGV